MKKPNKFFNNLGLKILAVVFAALLWLVCMNITDPVESKVFRDVDVELTNTSALTDEGKTYRVLDNTDSLNVTIRAARSVLDNISASDITATADFSELSYTNTVPIQLSLSKYVDSQIQEISGSVESVKLEVEDEVTRQLVITVSEEGTPADGYIVGRISVTGGNALRITGPESVVTQVDQAVVEVDLDGLTEDISIKEDILLLDENGSQVSASRLTLSVTTANVAVTIYETKEIPITLSYTGTPEEGYEATGEISCTPSTVTISGTSDSVAGVSEIVIPGDALDITGATEDVTVLVDLKEYLPNGVNLYSTSDDFTGKAAVTITVEPLVEGSWQIGASALLISNIPENYEVTLEDTETVTLRLIGLEQELAGVDETLLIGTVDIQAWIETLGLENAEDLESGQYEIPVEFEIPEGLELAADPTVSLTIDNLNEQEEEDEKDED